MNWVERDAAVVWHGFTQMSCYAENTPVIVERAEGRELIDVDGRRYLDAISSLWVTTLGHRVPELDEALREQLERVAHSTMLGNGNRIVIEFAEALAKDAGLNTINATKLSMHVLDQQRTRVLLNRFNATDRLHCLNAEWLAREEGLTIMTSIDDLL